MPRRCELVIVGGGIAGTTLAWTVRERRVDFLLVDDRPQVSSSRIAAGLVTPITGPRLAVAWRWEEFWPVATGFYEGVAVRIGEPVFHPRRMVRLFANAAEVGLFRERRLVDAAHLVAALDPSLGAPYRTSELGGFEMPVAGQLDVPRYLDRSWEVFTAEGCAVAARIDPAGLVATAQGVLVPELEVVAGKVVFAEGYTGVVNPWFPEVPYRPAKGEILTVRIPGLVDSRVVHGAVWLAPLGEERALCGSTYEWKELDQRATDVGRASILERLERLVEGRVEVLDQRAAVRPALRQFHPVVERSAREGRLFVLNGLGSKGSLQAPWCARQLVGHLLEGGALGMQ